MKKLIIAAVILAANSVLAYGNEMETRIEVPASVDQDLMAPVSCKHFGIPDHKNRSKIVNAGLRCVDNEFNIACYSVNAGASVYFSCHKIG